MSQRVNDGMEYWSLEGLEDWNGRDTSLHHSITPSLHAVIDP